MTDWGTVVATAQLTALEDAVVIAVLLWLFRRSLLKAWEKPKPQKKWYEVWKK